MEVLNPLAGYKERENMAVAMPLVKIHNTSSAVKSSINGAKKNEQAFAKAAIDVVNGYAAASNQLAAQFEGQGNLDNDTFLASSSDLKDPIFGMIDMKAAQHGYEASLKAFRTASEMEESLMDIMA